MGRLKPLTLGTRFGRWVVLDGPLRYPVKHGTEIYYRCRCDCGTEREVRSKALRTGRTTSCRCDFPAKMSAIKRQHGGSTSRLHKVWDHMKARCYRATERSYHLYGGRGITVCEAWRDSFATFQQWALSSGYADDLTIDRINNDGNYCPENCRWVGARPQANNRRSNHRLQAFGEERTLAEWESDPRCVVSHQRILVRLSRGWPAELALTTPPQHAGFRLPAALRLAHLDKDGPASAS